MPDAPLNLDHAGSRVEVVPYDPAWQAMYETERDRLELALGDAAAAVHHVGSTSVPGLPAKPCLDILVLTPGMPLVLARQAQMESLGYQGKGPHDGRPHHYFFRRLEGGRRRVHLHVIEQGHPQSDDYLLLRDYLRANPTARVGYGGYKQRLALTSRDREEYVSKKQEFVSGLLVGADAWRAAIVK